MSEISSGRPLFPLSVDTGALNSQVCIYYNFSTILYLWTQYKSIAKVKSHLAMRGRREDVAFFERVIESDNCIEFHTFY